MPTNLKSLLSRSRSKNELKLRESKDEISPSGNSKSSSSSCCSSDGCTCESSENHQHHACLKDASSSSYGCRQSSSESSLCSVTKAGGSYSSSQQSENDSSDDNCCYPPLASDLSYSNNCCRSDESRGDSCLMSENFLKSINSETTTTNSSTTTVTMIPSSGSSFHTSTCLPSQHQQKQHHHQQQQQQQQHQHHHHHHQNGHCGGAFPCSSSSQNYGSYEMQGPTMVAAGNCTGDYCGGGGYYLGEKPSLACTSRLVGVGGSNVMEQSDNSVEMRRNASCKTLFFSCTTLHHQPSCNSFESSHMDSTSEFSPGSCENPAGFCVTSSSSGNAAAVSSSSAIKIPTLSHQQHHHHHHHQARTNVADGCGSLAYGPPSASVCCTSSVANVKDGSPCQTLSLRKCETVLALSNFNGSSSTTTTNPITASNAKSYIRNPNSSGGAPTTYSNFPATTLSTTGASQLSSSSAVAAAAAAVPSSNVGGKVKVMKEKIFSTSSSALNCLLHSSSRTGKLLSGWKLSSANSSSNGGSNSNVGRISNMFSGSSEGSNCLGVNCHQPNKHFLGPSGISGPPAAAASSSGGNSGSSASNSTSDNNKVGSSASTKVTGHQHPPPSSSSSHHHHHHHKSRSQLSVSENSFSNSPAPLTPVNRLRRNVSVNNTSLFCPATSGGSLSAHSSYSRSSSVASFGWKEKEDPFEQSLECRLCLYKVRLEDTMEIHACSCRYCKDCLITYVSFEIQQGADEIACPDASCEKQGIMGLLEVEQLVPPMLLEKHKKFRLFREVEKDSNLMWCPSPGCETVCQIQDGSSILTGGFVTENDSRAAAAHGGTITAGGSRSLPFINCPTCRKAYCAECKLSWHPDSSCESFRRKLIKQGKLSSEDDELFSLDSIKKCPFCHVPIEKDSGCAQMMCKRCKHVFCWYCLASLDDDFLLRHYDKGPCKNKLGHSRASVVWHRAQVIGIFAGFGVLVLLASPLLILAAPCLLCCRCRYCANKLDPEESDLV